MEVAMEDVQEPSPPSSPVAAPIKMRRLRKVRESVIKESVEVAEVGVVVSQRISEVNEGMGRRETAEEVLKRFGKGLDVSCESGKKRKAVQSTIVAAVVNMAKQTETVAVGEVEEAKVVDRVDAEDGSLDLQSQGEGIADVSEEIAPLSKKKRSNTVKRCSVHAIGMTFESATFEDEGEAMADVENTFEMNNKIEENDRARSDSENGNEDVEDGGASDSEKGNEGTEGAEDGAGGLNAGWSDGWAGEEVSMESILEKARKMIEMSDTGRGSSKPTEEKKKPSAEDLTAIDDLNGKKKKGKKKDERMKREELFAESQRLLRESKGVAFVAPAPVTKPVSSVLEKIRQRRLQLGFSDAKSAPSSEVETKFVSRRANKERKTSHVDLTVDGDTEVEIENFSSNLVKTEEVKSEEVVVNVQGDRDVQIAEADGKSQDTTTCDEETPETSKGQKDLICDDLASRISDEKGFGLEPSHCILDTQASRISDEKDSGLEPSQCILDTQETQESLEATPYGSGVTAATDLMGLDTQPLDEDLMPRSMRGDHYKEDKETGSRLPGQSDVYTAATHVRGLIDDEAEDEDEDILAENAEEEVVLGDEEDLQDLFASTEMEKAGDKARRDALHRKWLDQQDTEQTEDILERLRTGRSTRWKGRDRVVSCLDEDEDLVNARASESLDKNYLSSQVGADDPLAEEDLMEEHSISLRQRTRGQELEMDCLLDDYEDSEDIAREKPVVEDEIIEDEEEHEKFIIRKRLLDESEEQLPFLSPAEDESSREVFSLINKVNVGNLKTKSTAGHLEIRSFGIASTSSLASKPSFLGRSSSSSSLPPPAQRQIGSGGNSRSFVFGRDDSNSGHGFPFIQSQEDKKPDAAKSVPDKGESKISTVNGKKRSNPLSTKGPSLFEMLKQQSKEFDEKKSTSSVAKKWGSNTEAFSMFASKKSVNLSRRKL